MNIIMYGGTFDPIHIGHMIVADEIYHHFKPDVFYFIPAGQNPLKANKAIATDEQRITMLQFAVDYLGFGNIEQYELNRQGKSYTYDTIQYLQQKHPDARISIVIGTDQYEAIDKWYNIEVLKEMVNFIVVNRSTDSNEALPSPFTNYHMPRIDMSSTLIRTRRLNNESIRCIVIDDIEQFIRKEHLYEAEKS